MKKTNIETTTFIFTKEYLIDIVETDENYEAYIYTKHDGIKMLMFGCPKEQQTEEEFFELVKGTVDEYIAEYECMFYEDEEE